MRVRARLGSGCGSLAAMAGLLATSPAMGQGRGVERRVRPEIPVWAGSITRVLTGPAGRAGPIPPGPPDGCPQVSNYTAYDFTSPLQAYAEAGMSQGETAAVTYVLSAADFPIKLNAAEVLWVTDGAAVQTTTQWTISVWSGTPSVGNLVFSESSDGSILPHVVMPPGTSGTVLTFSIDPTDPGQIVIQDNGSHQFTIGFRIDHHNNQPNSCTAPAPNSNAFLCVDADGLAQGGRNWLNAISCPLACPAGWWTFASYPAICRPSGDWLMRATWEPLNCAPATGACCLPGGTCQLQTSAGCVGAGGAYQGDGTACATTNCPQPAGACCLSNGNCLSLSQGDCGQISGSAWLGAGTACAGSLCPTGACCLANGNCLSSVTPQVCTGAGGVFRGANSTCATANCPQPTGACCLSGGGCLSLTQANCILIGTATWAGSGTTCGGITCQTCYANCDQSTTAPVLNVADFSCFLNSFAAGQSYANCDASTTEPVLNVADFSCFLNRFAAGCS